MKFFFFSRFLVLFFSLSLPCMNHNRNCRSVNIENLRTHPLHLFFSLSLSLSLSLACPFTPPWSLSLFIVKPVARLDSASPAGLNAPRYDVGSISQEFNKEPVRSLCSEQSCNVFSGKEKRASSGQERLGILQRIIRARVIHRRNNEKWLLISPTSIPCSRSLRAINAREYRR